MSPTDWTSLSEWMTAFRALHGQAKKGKLDEREQARYQQDREVLAMAFLIAQRLAIKPGLTPRQRLRVALSLPVALEGNSRSEETKTLDLGVGGFAIMLPKAMSVNTKYAFVMSLSSGKVKGNARVVNVQRKGKPFRIALAFDGLPPAEAEKISLEVFDAALTIIPPD